MFQLPIKAWGALFQKKSSPMAFHSKEESKLMNPISGRVPYKWKDRSDFASLSLSKQCKTKVEIKAFHLWIPLLLTRQTREPILQVSAQICRRQDHDCVPPHIPHYTVILSAHSNLFSFPQMKAWWSGVRETYRDLLSVLGNIQKQNRSFAGPLGMSKPTVTHGQRLYTVD